METILLCKTKNLLSSSYRNSFNISFIMKTAFVFFYLLFSFTAIIAQNPIADTVHVYNIGTVLLFPVLRLLIYNKRWIEGSQIYHGIAGVAIAINTHSASAETNDNPVFE